MQISPDSVIFWRYGVVVLNGTIVFTWVVMLLLTAGAWLLTRRLSSGATVSRRQTIIEAIVTTIHGQIKEVTPHQPKGLQPFLGTLFLFIAVSNTLSAVPGFHAPTGSLSTPPPLRCWSLWPSPHTAFPGWGFAPIFPTI